MYCWGHNNQGQLGDNSQENKLIPTPISSSTTYRQIAAGGNHTCGVSTSGVALCWGYNYYGQIGINNGATRRLTPSMVSGGLSFAQITVGSPHTCGVTIDNQAYCWGNGLNGRLGDRMAVDRLAPRQVATPPAYFAELAAGSSHTCGLTSAAVYCWGNNGSGHLGLSGTSQELRPTTWVGGLPSAIQITAGGQHACALVLTGQVYCWGANGSGQLSDGTTGGSRSTPAPVAGDLHFVQVSAGNLHTCGITRDRKAYCWGFNTAGQLGDGSYQNRSVPRRWFRFPNNKIKLLISSVSPVKGDPKSNGVTTLR